MRFYFPFLFRLFIIYYLLFYISTDKLGLHFLHSLMYRLLLFFFILEIAQSIIHICTSIKSVVFLVLNGMSYNTYYI